MALPTQTSEDGQVLTIEMPERFDFDIHADLRKTYQDKDSVNCFIINLGQTNYLDSSALGMLLQLREHAGNRNDSVKIINARDSVMEILNVANFDKMLTIEH